MTATELLCALSDLIGPSGWEGPVRDALRHWLAPEAAAEDALGSLLLRRQGPAGARRVLVLVPMDEPGVVLTHLDEHGRGSVAALGPVQPAAAAGRLVRFACGAVAALVPAGEGGRAERPAEGFDGMRLDFGVSDRGAAERLVRLGEAAAFDVPARPLPGGPVCGKALSSRAACAAAVLAWRAGAQAGWDVTLCFLAQSALGHRGVGAAVARCPADLILSLGAVAAAAGGDAAAAGVRLGEGPALLLSDRGIIASAPAVDALTAAAAAAGVSLQVAVNDPGTAAAGPALTAAAGVPAGALGIPVRHLYGTAEVCDPGDVEATAVVLARLLAGAERAG